MKIKKSRHIKEFDLKNLLLKRTLIFTYIQATSIKEVGQQWKQGNTVLNNLLCL